MDQNRSITQSAAQLWIGNPDTLIDQVITQLQQLFCIKKGCGVCIPCIQLKTQQHHNVMWFYPETHYTRDQFNPLFHILSFTLQQNEMFFFIIQKADFLTLSTSNQLLKSLEEPPVGYHFILLAERLDPILPTIRSRCIIQKCSLKDRETHHALFDYFITRTFQDPAIFLKKLDQTNINERESIELLDGLIHYWSTIYKKAIEQKNDTVQEDAVHMIAVLKHAFEWAPMPGSSKLFWKNIFLQIQK